MFLQNIRENKRLKYLILFPVYILVIYLIWSYIPEKYYVDWVYGFRPAVWEMLNWQSPYNGHGVFNPPWTFILLLPLALFPPKVGALLLTILTFFSLLYIALRLGASPYIALSFLLIPQVAFKAITNPNIDFLAAFGFILPPQIGLFFLAIKPQIGIGVAIYWFFEAWWDGGWKKVIKVFAPISIALLISFLIFGPYFLQGIHLTDHEATLHSYPLWPYALPVGFALLSLAIKQREKNISITSSQFLSPYVATYTYPFALLGLVKYRLIYWSAYIGMWLVFILLR